MCPASNILNCLRNSTTLSGKELAERVDRWDYCPNCIVQLKEAAQKAKDKMARDKEARDKEARDKKMLVGSALN